MQYIQRVSFKAHQAGSFGKWLTEHEVVFAQHAPQGWSYLGTWFTVRGFGRYDCEIRWELTDYDALGSGFGDEAFQQAMQEAIGFFDFAQGSETYLMKSAADVYIMPGS